MDTQPNITVSSHDDENSTRSEVFPTGVYSWKVTIKPHTWHPPTDLYETEDEFIVRVEVAGMSQEEFCVSLNNDVIDITGTRPDLPLRRAFHQMEIPFGEFRTTINLPSTVDSERVTAEYHDGFLEVHLPKSPQIVININHD